MLGALRIEIVATIARKLRKPRLEIPFEKGGFIRWVWVFSGNCVLVCQRYTSFSLFFLGVAEGGFSGFFRRVNGSVLVLNFG